MTAASGPVDLPALTRVFHDYLTAADGETFAIGRGLAMAMFAAGLFLPYLVAIWAICTIHPSLPDWAIFLGAVGVYYGALATAVMLLISGTKATEPKAPDAPAPAPAKP